MTATSDPRPTSTPESSLSWRRKTSTTTSQLTDSNPASPAYARSMSTGHSDSEVPGIPYVLDEGEGEVLRWFGATLIVKASGPTFDVALSTEVAGSEPPLHLHADHDEGLLVVRGELTVYAGDEILAANAGSFVFLPRGVPHTFAVDSDSAQLAVVLAPAGALAMYDDIQHRRVVAETAAHPGPVDPGAPDEALAGLGVTVLGPNPRNAAPPPPTRKDAP